MNVLLISQYFWPESFRINEVVTSLREVGCHVTVITGQPNYPDGRIFAGYRAFGAGVERHSEGYDIFRVPLWPRGKGNGIRLVLNYLSFVISVLIFGPWLLRGKHFDIVFVYGVSPILQGIPAAALSAIKRAVLVIWVQDLWPQSLEVTGFLKNRLLLNMIGWITRRIYACAQLLLVQSKAFIPIVQSMAPKICVKYHPNPGDIAMAELSQEPLRDWESGNGFRVVFAGNLGAAQALETVLEAACELASDPDIRLILVGSGRLYDWLMAQIESRGIGNIELPGRFPAEAMPGILSEASVLLATLKKGDVLSQTIPSKIQTYLAVGRPIIASMDGEGARVVTEAGAGVACPAEDSAALAAAIRYLKACSQDKTLRMGNSGRRYFDSHFNPTMLAEQLRDHFSQALARQSTADGEPTLLR